MPLLLEEEKESLPLYGLFRPDDVDVVKTEQPSEAELILMVYKAYIISDEEQREEMKKNLKNRKSQKKSKNKQNTTATITSVVAEK